MVSSSEVESTTKPHPLSAAVLPGGLFESEYFWREHQAWLATSGYMLRPRYRLDWEPSWLKSKTSPFFCEDGRSSAVSFTVFLRLSRPYGILQRTTIMDAVRTSDKRVVVLKQVPKSRYPIEEELNHFLTMSEPQASDRHNYSVPVYEILQSPLDENVLILVMPYLARIYSVKFATVGEAVECFRQLFEVSMVFVSP